MYNTEELRSMIAYARVPQRDQLLVAHRSDYAEASYVELIDAHEHKTNANKHVLAVAHRWFNSRQSC